jgi:hypothetical protein
VGICPNHVRGGGSAECLHPGIFRRSASIEVELSRALARERVSFARGELLCEERSD